MRNNAKQFREFLKEYLEESSAGVEEEVKKDNNYFVLNYKIEGGARVTFLFAFRKDDELVEICSYNYINVSDNSKRSLIIEKINRLNSKYTYSKFVLTEDNNIKSNAFYPSWRTLSPNYYGLFLLELIELLKKSTKIL